jgi:hypothetical protein
VALERHDCISLSRLAPGGVLLVQFVGDAFVGEADELRERRVRMTGTARQRRDEAGQRREGMTIDRPKIDGLRRVARRTTHPQEPMPCLERAADRCLQMICRMGQRPEARRGRQCQAKPRHLGRSRRNRLASPNCRARISGARSFFSNNEAFAPPSITMASQSFGSKGSSPAMTACFGLSR